MQLFSLSHCSSSGGKPGISFRFSCSRMSPSFNLSSAEALSRDALDFHRSRNVPVRQSGEEKNRVLEALSKVQLSVSSYDTAWVAMVPSPRFPKIPCFPQCIEWILDNQHTDGSWGLRCGDLFMMKDVLSSTLACVLALRRWDIGEEHVKRGLNYVGLNFSSIMDKSMQSPIGFDIIFPGMIGHAIDMGLDLPLCQSDIDYVLHMRELELKRSCGDGLEGIKAYHAYLAEGLREIHDWQEVMKYQKKNGSLFNSPSATASAIIYTQDEKALNYLRSVLQRFGNSVPTVYPLDMHTKIHMIDDLERLGISGHFTCEKKSILDNIYRCWMGNDEEITSDVALYAMAFRILRMNGYDVSSDALAHQINQFNDSVQGYLRDASTVLELYKASQVKLLPNEQVLEKIEFWASSYLKEDFTTDVSQQVDAVSDEVDYVLKFPFYANLDRLEHKRHIEHRKKEKAHLLKTSYVNYSINNEDFLNAAIEDFNISQSIYRKEFKCLESWVKENKLDQLAFARQKLAYCYLSTAATLFPAEMSDSRMCWAKNSVLTTVVDDFFDVGGSAEELLNIIELVEKWDGIHGNEFCSKQVEIVFSAIYKTTNDLGAKASALQGRNVISHIIEIWLSLMKSMMKETQWLRNKSVPTLDEYMENGYVSFALGPIILPALYFVGPKLSEDIIRGLEYHKLYRLVSTCGRLLNDMQGFERECKEGKLNSLSLRILHSNGSISEADAKRETESLISSTRQDLLKLVLQKEESLGLGACKDLFWKMSKVLHFFYLRTDGFTSPNEMFAAVNAVIHDPLEI